MTTNKQIVTAIKKSLSKIDFAKTIEKYTNEAQTRLYLNVYTLGIFNIIKL